MQHPSSLLKALWFLLPESLLHRIGCRPPSEPCCPVVSSEGYVQVNSSLTDSLVYNMLFEPADPDSRSSSLWVTLPLGVPGQGSYSTGEFGEDWFSHLCGAQSVVVMLLWWPGSHCPSCFSGFDPASSGHLGVFFACLFWFFFMQLRNLKSTKPFSFSCCWVSVPPKVKIPNHMPILALKQVFYSCKTLGIGDKYNYLKYREGQRWAMENRI